MRRSILMVSVVVLGMSTLVACSSIESTSTPLKESTSKVTSDATEATTEQTKVEYKSVYTDEYIDFQVGGVQDDWSGKAIKTRIINKSDKNITVQERDFSINGCMIDPIYSAEIATGKQASSDISILSSYLEANGITNITDVEFTIHICDSESWDTIKDSDTITLKF